MCVILQGEVLGRAVIGMAETLANAFHDPRALASALVHPAGEACGVVIEIKAVRELTAAIKDLTGALDTVGGAEGAPCGVVILPEAALGGGTEGGLPLKDEAGDGLPPMGGAGDEA